MRLTEEQAEELFKEDGIDLIIGRLELVESGDWEDGGKWCYAYNIYKDDQTNKFYRATVGRSGSYYSDYCYDYGLDLEEVVQKEVVKKVWKVVDSRGGN